MKSRKLIVTILAAIGMVVNDVFGKPVSEETMYAALGLIGTYILGQGVADHGAQGAARVAIQDGKKLSEGVEKVIDKVEESLDGDDDGPNWDDNLEDSE